MTSTAAIPSSRTPSSGPDVGVNWLVLLIAALASHLLLKQGLRFATTLADTTYPTRGLLWQVAHVFACVLRGMHLLALRRLRTLDGSEESGARVKLLRRAAMVAVGVLLALDLLLLGSRTPGGPVPYSLSLVFYAAPPIALAAWSDALSRRRGLTSWFAPVVAALLIIEDIVTFSGMLYVVSHVIVIGALWRVASTSRD